MRSTLPILLVSVLLLLLQCFSIFQVQCQSSFMINHLDWVNIIEKSTTKPHILHDKDNNVIVVGTFASTIKLGGQPVVVGDQGAFVAHFNSDGQYLWSDWFDIYPNTPVAALYHTEQNRIIVMSTKPLKAYGFLIRSFPCTQGDPTVTTFVDSLDQYASAQSVAYITDLAMENKIYNASAPITNTNIYYTGNFTISDVGKFVFLGVSDGWLYKDPDSISFAITTSPRIRMPPGMGKIYWSYAKTLQAGALSVEIKQCDLTAPTGPLTIQASVTARNVEQLMSMDPMTGFLYLTYSSPGLYPNGDVGITRYLSSSTPDDLLIQPQNDQSSVIVNNVVASGNGDVVYIVGKVKGTCRGVKSGTPRFTLGSHQPGVYEGFVLEVKWNFGGLDGGWFTSSNTDEEVLNAAFNSQLNTLAVASRSASSNPNLASFTASFSLPIPPSVAILQLLTYTSNPTPIPDIYITFDVVSSVTWSSVFIYHIPYPISVFTGATLNITTGTQIIIEGLISVMIGGSITANNNDCTKMIDFKSALPTNSTGIVVNAGGACYLSCCRMSSVNGNSATIVFKGTMLTIFDSEFSNNFGKIIVSTSQPTTTVTLNNNRFAGDSIGIEITVVSAVINIVGNTFSNIGAQEAINLIADGSSTVFIQKNTILNSKYGIHTNIVGKSYMKMDNNRVLNMDNSGIVVTTNVDSSSMIIVLNNTLSDVRQKPMFIQVIRDGGHQIDSNKFMRTSGVAIMDIQVLSTSNCLNAVQVKNNLFQKDTPTTYLVRMEYPDKCASRATFTHNTLNSLTSCLLSLVGPILFQRNTFSDSNSAIKLKHSGIKVLNAQYNYWGTLPLDIESRLDGFTKAPKPSILYTPYLVTYDGTNTAEVELFSGDEKTRIVNCQDVDTLFNGTAPDGTYHIYPDCEDLVVSCDMNKHAFVIQRRTIDSTVFKQQLWDKYQTGFGSLDEDYWIGLDALHMLTSWGNANIEIEVEWAQDLSLGTQIYRNFSVGPSSTDYGLSVGPLIGGDLISKSISFTSHSGYSFATNDHFISTPCANSKGSGWWYTGDCYGLNLNEIQTNEDLWTIRNTASLSSTKMRLTHLSSNATYCPSTPMIDLTITGKSTIKLCEDVELQVITAVPSASIYWELVPTGNSLPDEVVIANYLSVLPPSEHLSVDTMLLSPQKQYTFRAIARLNGNELGRGIFTVNRGIQELVDTLIQFEDIPEANITILTTEDFHVSAKLVNIPQCISSVSKNWILFYNETYTMVNTTNNQVTFFIGRNTLTPGFYRLTFRAQLYHGYSTKESNLYLTVLRSNPVAVIQGGNRMTNQDQAVYLNGGRSHDNTISNPRYVWTCDKCSAQSNYPKEAVSISFVESVPAIYNISLIYYPYGSDTSRFSTAWTQIEVLSSQTVVPMPTIITVVDQIISSQKKLKLEASITIPSNNNKDKIEYEWLIESVQGSKSMGKVFTLSPLVIPENTLEHNTVYTFKLRARFDTTQEVYGIATATTTTASRPAIKTLTVTPSNRTGTALKTIFGFSIDAQDATVTSEGVQYPLTYSFSYYQQNEGKFVPIVSNSRSSSLETSLPSGYGSTNQLTIRCIVQNSYGTSTYQDVVLTLIVPSSDTMLSSLETAAAQLLTPNNSPGSSNSAAVLSVITATIDQLAKNVTNNTSAFALVSSTASQIMTFVQNDLESVLNSGGTLSRSSVITALSTVNVLTRNINILPVNSTKSIFAVLGSVLDSTKKSHESLDDNQVNLVASSISNVYNGYVKDYDLSKRTVNAVEQLSRVIIADKLVSEEETSIRTDSFSLTVKVDSADNIISSQPSIKDQNGTLLAQINLPSVIPQLNSSNEVQYALELISYSKDNNPYSWSPTSKNISTSVISFKILSPENGEKISIQNLTQPIEIVLKKEVGITNRMLNSYQCQYWSEATGDAWFADGCWVHNETSTEIICHCSHTTSFSSMIIYDVKNPSNNDKEPRGLYITKIVINSLFTVTCIALLVALVCWRDKQPIKSRFLAPYLGLSAILIECILNGIIRNSLLIAAKSAKNYRGINDIAYVIMTIVNPIVLVSLFIYFWQMLRYLFQKNLYAIMDIARPNHFKMRILRVLSSKVIYIAIATGIALASCTYFVIVAILEATGTIGPDAATSFNALSFSCMSFAIGFLIISAFVWDSTVILARKTYKRRTGTSIANVDDDEQTPEASGSVELDFIRRAWNGFIKHFSGDDPLLFRIESLFMVTAMLLMFTSYILGICQQLVKKKSEKGTLTLQALEFLFDVSYICLRICAFGGFAVLVRIRHRFKLHNQHEQYVQLKQYMSDLKKGTNEVETELLSLLRDEMGFSLFSCYAKKEFALENLLLWKLLEKLRSENIIMTEEERACRLKSVHEKYLANGSPYEVNIGAKAKRLVDATIKENSLNAATMEESLLALFNEAMVNICDTYTRFTVSEECQLYRKIHTATQQLKQVSNLN